MKTFAKFKKNFMLMLVVASPLLLGGAKYWQDPAGLPEDKNCANGVCCARCVDNGDGLSHLAGWEWKLKVASRFMR
jgi:hypothetical protein